MVLDNCEHLIEAAAHLARSLLQAAPRVHLLATSREPLDVPGERVHRLAPLESPPEEGRRSGEQLRTYSAVELFVRRALARGEIEFSEQDLLRVADETADAVAVFKTLMCLTGKLPLVADPSGDRILYRLLDTSRLYALEKLRESGEFAVIRTGRLPWKRSIYPKRNSPRSPRPRAGVACVCGPMPCRAWAWSASSPKKVTSTCCMTTRVPGEVCWLVESPCFRRTSRRR